MNVVIAGRAVCTVVNNLALNAKCLPDNSSTVFLVLSSLITGVMENKRYATTNGFIVRHINYNSGVSPFLLRGDQYTIDIRRSNTVDDFFRGALVQVNLRNKRAWFA